MWSSGLLRSCWLHCWLQVSPDNGWVPIWRAPMLAVVVLVCSLFALLLGAILVSNRLQSWLKVSTWWWTCVDLCGPVLTCEGFGLQLGWC
jgi:hypothetical protein